MGLPAFLEEIAFPPRGVRRLLRFRGLPGRRKSKEEEDQAIFLILVAFLIGVQRRTTPIFTSFYQVDILHPRSDLLWSSSSTHAFDIEFIDI